MSPREQEEKDLPGLLELAARLPEPKRTELLHARRHLLALARMLEKQYNSPGTMTR